MKIYLRIFLLLFFSTPSFCLENKIYSISVCTTSTKEEANRCKENISKISNLETFVQENPNKTYSSYLGNFNSYDEAKHILNNSPAFIKKQKPFIKIIEKKVANENIQILDEKINEKIKQIDESIIKINKEITKIEEKPIIEEKAIREEQQKKAEIEIQRLKEELQKSAEMQTEIQRLKSEQEKTEKLKKEIEEKRVEELKIQKEKELKEKTIIEEQQKKAEMEIQRLKEELQKSAEMQMEIQRLKSEQEKAEKLKKEVEEKRVEELKIQKEKELKEKAIIEEQQKKSEIEIQRLKSEQEKELKEKAIIEEQQKKSEAEKLKKEIKESKNLDFSNYLEDMKKLNGMAISSIKPNAISILNNSDSFENLIIQVDSNKNIMFLKGKNKDGKIIDIKTYKVSTAKTNIKKPQGIGSITSISLNPQWNPTDRTLKAFRQKGIILPSVVPFGHKLNYMGSAKINLTHKVDGQEVYRIHGTLSEDTIGTNESGGCIRMKNKEVVELATLLNEFTNYKDFSKVKVILE